MLKSIKKYQSKLSNDDEIESFEEPEEIVDLPKWLTCFAIKVGIFHTSYFLCMRDADKYFMYIIPAFAVLLYQIIFIWTLLRIMRESDYVYSKRYLFEFCATMIWIISMDYYL